jgi:hypothetical protein
MKTSACLLLPAVLGGLLVSAAPAAEPVPEAFGFTLVPNAFSANPRLAMTIFTEMTDYGRTLPVVSAAAPVYFTAHDHGRRSEGDVVGESVFPTPAGLQETLFRALAVNGYQPAAAGQAPGLVLIYYWGSHNAMADLELIQLFPELHHQQVLERAMLVGGSTYRRKIADEFSFGYTFADRMAKKAFLFNQVSQDVYFVVVSAYDHAALAAGRRQLAWRTTMTVSTAGIAMRDALPPLVVTAGDYFGRETGEPVAIVRRARRGTVTLGPLRIIEDHGQTDLARK